MPLSDFYLKCFLRDLPTDGKRNVYLKTVFARSSSHTVFAVLDVVLGKCGFVCLKAELVMFDLIKQVNSQGGSVPLVGT